MASYLDKLQKIPPKTRLIAFIAIIVLLVIAYIIQFQIPMKTQITDLEKTLSDLNSKIHENDGKIKKLDELKIEVKMLQQRLLVLTQQLPPESEVTGLLRQIQNLVNQSGLVLRLWRPDRRRLHPSGLYEEIPITLALTGGYHNTATFFDRVGKLTRIVNILNIRMGGAKMTVSGSMDINIDCMAMTFSAVEKKVDAAQTNKNN
ncbi:MAG TPA: type 4a pilus biogenesis protein PilO [Nitrospirota bacterium]|nr:type 4a pilus biogenesis protein PilO [Nitrospirota bacterium]